MTPYMVNWSLVSYSVYLHDFTHAWPPPALPTALPASKAIDCPICRSLRLKTTRIRRIGDLLFWRWDIGTFTHGLNTSISTSFYQSELPNPDEQIWNRALVWKIVSECSGVRKQSKQLGGESKWWSEWTSGREPPDCSLFRITERFGLPEEKFVFIDINRGKLRSPKQPRGSHKKCRRLPFARFLFWNH